MVTVRNIRRGWGGGGISDKQPNPSGAELGATGQQYMLGETFLTKVRQLIVCAKSYVM